MHRRIAPMFSSPQIYRLLAAVFVAGCLLLALPCRSQSRLSKAQIEERLRFLATVDHYSPSAPLSQDALMKLALEERYWGVFPKAYCGKEQRPGADGYITRAMTRRFLQDLTGQDLRIWKSDADEIKGDEMTWVYNTANTTYQRASVRLTGRKDVGKSQTDATFQVFDYPANSNGSQPVVKVGTGTATLKHIDQHWTVTTWKVVRLHAHKK